MFDPYDLDLDVTPASVRRQLRQAEWATAIVLAFRLNETALTQEVLEAVPHHQSECSWVFLFPSRCHVTLISGQKCCDLY